VTISLTKVVNETLSIDGDDSIFGGIYIPTFTVDQNSLFFTGDQFVRSTLTSTTLKLVLSETPYYVKNLQQPIAKSSEIIFQNLLFITVCLELFGLLFLSYKLLFKPFYVSLLKKRYDRKQHEYLNKQNTSKDLRQDDKSVSGHTIVDVGNPAYF
jgi:hypothetical protein